MVLRRILAEAVSQASEATRQRDPIELFDLQSIRPEPESEALLQRSRDIEAIGSETKRPGRTPPVPVATRRVHPGEVRRADVLSSLRSPDGIRRALVLREILGPPRSISGWDDM